MEMLNEIDILEEQRNEVFAIGAIYSDYINCMYKLTSYNDLDILSFLKQLTYVAVTFRRES